jgi:hypothetical protein
MTLADGCLGGCQSLSRVTFEFGSALSTVTKDPFPICGLLVAIWVPESIAHHFGRYQRILRVYGEEGEAPADDE